MGLDDKATEKQIEWIKKLRHIADKRGVLDAYTSWFAQNFPKGFSSIGEAGQIIAYLSELTDVGRKIPKREKEAINELLKIFGGEIDGSIR